MLAAMQKLTDSHTAAFMAASRGLVSRAQVSL
jgi:hypothetical protein